MINIEQTVSDMMERGLSSQNLRQHKDTIHLCERCSGSGVFYTYGKRNMKNVPNVCSLCSGSGRVNVEISVDITITPFKQQKEDE